MRTRRPCWSSRLVGAHLAAGRRWACSPARAEGREHEPSAPQYRFRCSLKRTANRRMADTAGIRDFRV